MTIEIERKQRKRLKYAQQPVTFLSQGRALAPEDDPMSPSFVPMEERSELERARLFFKLKERKSSRQKIAQM